MSEQNDSRPTSPRANGDLRLIAELFDEAQERRIALGERLRAIHQGRTTVSDAPVAVADAGDAIARAGRGEDTGAPALLESAYAAATAHEDNIEAELTRVVHAHPAWPWMSQVRGIGPLLAGRLLARLDVHRAPTPSSFWAYCGLATVPGVRYLCDTCGLDVTLPQGFRIQNAHRTRGSERTCAGTLQLAAEQLNVRAAPRRPVKGESASFDARARKYCYLIGVSFLRAGGEYRDYYDEQRVAIAASHPGWPRARVHMSALRKTEKLFLKNLWIAWRTVEGLPIVPPYRPDNDVAEVA